MFQLFQEEENRSEKNEILFSLQQTGQTKELSVAVADTGKEFDSRCTLGMKTRDSGEYRIGQKDKLRVGTGRARPHPT